MGEKRKLSQDFTFEEKDYLIKIVSMYKDIVLNKKTDFPTYEAKAKAWGSIAARFNSSANNHHSRSKYSLVTLWEKMKKEARIYKKNLTENAQNKRSSIVKIDPILEQVYSIVEGTNLDDADIPNMSDDDKSNQLPLNITISVKQDTNVTDTTRNEINHDYNGSGFKVDEADLQVSENSSPPSPIWLRSRRARLINDTNERIDATNSLCISYGNLNEKGMSVEELKEQLLTEEMEFKRKLYQLKLEAAAKDLEIKTEILKQIKDGKIHIKRC